MNRFRSPEFVAVLLIGLVTFAACRREPSEPSKGVKTPAASEAPVVKPAPAKPAEPARPEPTVAATPTVSTSEVPPASAAPEAAPAPAAEAEAEGETALELLGVIRASGRPPSALIAYQGSQEIFRKGDSVFDQGTLGEVKEDAVVLHRGAKDVTLEIRRSVAAAPPTPEMPALELQAPSASEPAPPPVEKAIPRSEVRESLRRLGKVLADAGAERVAVGRGHGLQLKSVGTASFFARLGLKSGDILQKLNGTPVEDLGNLPDLSGAADRAELTVSFVRNDIGLTFSRPMQ